MWWSMSMVLSEPASMFMCTRSKDKPFKLDMPEKGSFCQIEDNMILPDFEIETDGHRMKSWSI